MSYFQRGSYTKTLGGHVEVRNMPAADLKAIALAHLREDQLNPRSRELKSRISEILGTVPTDPVVTQGFEEAFADLLVKRLQKGRAEHLLSIRDVERILTPILIKELEKDCLDPMGRRFAKSFCLGVVRNIVGKMFGKSSQRKARRDYEKLVKAVMELASARGISAVDLMNQADVWDELARRTTTKKRFLAARKRGLAQYDLARAMRGMVSAMLSYARIKDPKKCREVRRAFRMEFLAQYEEKYAQARAVALAHWEAEANRIWGDQN